MNKLTDRSIFDLLYLIRRHPVLHLTMKSLDRLELFVGAYRLGLALVGYSLAKEDKFFGGFDAWVAQQLNALDKEKSYYRLILEKCHNNEEEAFDMFFQYLDSYLQSIGEKIPKPILKDGLWVISD